jgi:hypothetical protein
MATAIKKIITTVTYGTARLQKITKTQNDMVGGG